MNYDPAFVPLDKMLESTVATAARMVLDGFAEASLDATEEEDPIHVPIPVLTPDNLREHLEAATTLREDALPAQRAYLSALIAQQVVSLLVAQTELDRAMEDFLKEAGIIDATKLFVNDPAALSALDDYELPPHEVMLIPLEDFYGRPQIPGDPRQDMLMGVIAWNGVFLCRPALVSLADIQDKLAEADKFGVLIKTPNVVYVPRYGVH